MNTQIIEIIFPGSHSVKGAILEEFNLRPLEAKKFQWVIFTNPNSFDMIENECKAMGLNYFIVDRLTAKINLKET